MAESLTCVYKAKDGKILINTDMDEWFQATCRVLKCDHLHKDARFKAAVDRQAPSWDEDGKETSPMGKNFPALHAELQKVVASLARGDLEKKLTKVDVPAMKL